MTGLAGPGPLADLAGWAYGFVVLFARVGALCMLLPGIGEAELPMMLRLGFALALDAVLLPVVAPGLPPAPAGGFATVAVVLGETLVGLWLGWMTRLWILALPAAGTLVATACGLANVLQPDPSLGPQTPALGRALGLAAPVIVLASGLYALPLEALGASYRLAPPGHVPAAGDLLETLVAAAGASLALSLRLAAPFVLAGIVWHTATGVLSRLIPQLQVFFAALPGQILGGLVLAGLLAGAMLQAWQARVGEAFAALPGH